MKKREFIGELAGLAACAPHISGQKNGYRKS